MTCETATALIVDSLLDELDAEQQSQLDAHLKSCPSCAAEAKRLRRMWGDLATLPASEPSPTAAVEFGRRLGQARRRRMPLALRAAVVASLLVAGALLGRLLPVLGPETAAPGGEPAFLLLLRGEEPERRASSEQLIQEYTAWARELRGGDRLIAAERLTDDPGTWISADSASSAEWGELPVSGFFVIRAADYGEAVRIAGGSPHFAYGGIIEVRAVDHR